MSSSSLVELVALCFCILLTLTLTYWRNYRLRNAELTDLLNADKGGTRNGLWTRLEKGFAASRPGTRLGVYLRATNISLSALSVVLALVAVTLLASYLAFRLAGMVAGAVVLFLIPFGFKSWLSNQHEKRLARLIGQLPQVARILANATSSGLSIQRGMQMVSTEMSKPASEEFAQAVHSLEMGVTLQQALTELRDRNPSREVSVLIQTVVIQSRVGGKLVSALTDIAATLEDRKELAREALTATSGARFSGYMVAAIGILAPIAIASASGSSIDELLHTDTGRIAAAVGGTMIAAGIWLMSKLAKVKV